MTLLLAFTNVTTLAVVYCANYYSRDLLSTRPTHRPDSSMVKPAPSLSLDTVKAAEHHARQAEPIPPARQTRPKSKPPDVHRKKMNIAFMVLGMPGSKVEDIAWATKEIAESTLLYIPNQHCDREVSPAIKISNIAWSTHPGSWWCAQSEYLRAVLAVVQQFPNADYYFLADSDTLIFTVQLQRLVDILDHDILKPQDDLYMGHVWEANIYDEHVSKFDIIMSGSGVVVRGRTLRRAVQEGVVKRVHAQMTKDKLVHWHADWAVAECMRLIGVQPLAHEGFQQFANEQGCPLLAVACHKYNNQIQRQIINSRRPLFSVSIQDVDWAAPCGSSAKFQHRVCYCTSSWSDLVDSSMVATTAPHAHSVSKDKQHEMPTRNGLCYVAMRCGDWTWHDCQNGVVSKWYTVNIAHHAEFAYKMFALSSRHNEAPATIVWPKLARGEWTNTLLNTVAFPQMKFAETLPGMCGNTDTNPRLEKDDSSLCCDEVVQIDPGRWYFGGGGAYTEESHRAAVSLRDRTYDSCDIPLGRAQRTLDEDIRIVHVRRDTPFNSGGIRFRNSVAELSRELYEAHSVKMVTRFTKRNAGLCDQVRLFAQADVVICAHGQQLTTTALAMEPGSLLLEVSPRMYYPNDGPSMFALQNRNGDFQHTVLHSNGGRVDMPFNPQEAYEIIKKHSERNSQKPV
jgi:hypothetical protein